MPKGDLRAEHRAPDGGPVVRMEAVRKFKGITHYPLVLVRSKATGQLVRVRKEEAANPDLYEPVTDTTPTRPKIEKPKGFQPSDFNEETLATMPVQQLRTLPEWELVPNKNKLKSKQEIVEALLAARAEAAELE